MRTAYRGPYTCSTGGRPANCCFLAPPRGFSRGGDASNAAAGKERGLALPRRLLGERVREEGRRRALVDARLDLRGVCRAGVSRLGLVGGGAPLRLEAGEAGDAGRLSEAVWAGRAGGDGGGGVSTVFCVPDGTVRRRMACHGARVSSPPLWD